MGKWSQLRGKLPAFQPEKEYQQKINDRKSEILGLAKGQRPTKAAAEHANLAFLGRVLVTARRTKDRCEDKLYDVNITLAALDQLITDRMEGEEQESVSLRGGVSFGLKDDVYPTIEDRGKFFRWIKATKQIDLLSIHFKRFQAVVKSYIEAGRPTPPGAKVFLKTTVAVRGLRGKAKENGNGDE